MQFVRNFKKIAINLFAVVLGGCAIGTSSIAMDTKRTTTYDSNNRVVSVVEEKKINEPISKAGLATVAVAISSNPLAAAIVAGAQSIGDGIGMAFKKSGDVVDSVTGMGSGQPNFAIMPKSAVAPQPIPSPEENKNGKILLEETK